MKTTLIKLTKKNTLRTNILTLNISMGFSETKLFNKTILSLIQLILMKLLVFKERSAKSGFCRSLTFTAKEWGIRTTTYTILERSLQDLQMISNIVSLIRDFWRLIATIVNLEIVSLYRQKYRRCLREEKLWVKNCFPIVHTTLIK